MSFWLTRSGKAVIVMLFFLGSLGGSGLTACGDRLVSVPAESSNPKPAVSSSSFQESDQNVKMDAKKEADIRTERADGVASTFAVERSWSRVVIDAGHGGEDLGAVGASGSFEKDITFAISRATARALRDRGYQVLESRNSDEAMALERRTGLTNASGAGLFLSIHANSAPAAAAHGIETYYMDLASDEAALRLAERENRAGRAAGAVERAPVDGLVDDLRMGAVAKQSKVFAEITHEKLLQALQGFYGGERIRDRGVRTAPFWVLVDAQVPAILVEVGYLTNAKEEQRLRTRAYHQRVSEALAEAVDDFATRAAATDLGYTRRSLE